MKISELSVKQKIAIILLGFIFIIVISLIFFIKPSGKYGNEVGINNYDKYISNLPADKRSAINNTIFNIVKNNLKSGGLNINNAIIRDGSVEYNYNKTTNINSGSFIVDLQSIKQSYLITYEWSSDNNNINLSGYTATAACLPLNKLIYGNFDCKDDFTNSKNVNSRDPILDYLPYSTFNYTITANINDNNKVDLNVDIILYSSDTRNDNRDNVINNYKSEIINWIKSKSLNPDSYIINYTIN